MDNRFVEEQPLNDLTGSMQVDYLEEIPCDIPYVRSNPNPDPYNIPYIIPPSYTVSI